MIACICHAVSDKEIRRLAREGADFAEIRERTRACTGCGQCTERVKLLVEAEAEAAQPYALAAK